MAHAEPDLNLRPDPDPLLQQLADYTLDARIDSAEAWETARYCTLDALGCGLLALTYPACAKLIGPVVPEAVLPGSPSPTTWTAAPPAPGALASPCARSWRP
jgi:2-methylcitrate dehydratase PrpD